MPDAPPAVATVDAELRSLTAALRRDFAAASAAIEAELAELLERWPGQPQPVRMRNLRALQGNVTALMRSSRTLARDALPEAVAGAYQLGSTATAVAAQAAVTFAAVDRASVAVLARDTYRDLLEATEHMADTTKDVVRRLARDHARDRMLTGRTATQAARRLERDLAGQGISAITYRNGANHTLADYSDMVIRTKTAEAFQVGGFNQARALGIEWFEILDNPSCGLDGHDDPTKANGQIVRRETAERFPLSHPRCVRVSTARPDIEDLAQARSQAALSAGAEGRRVADQQLVEMAREEAAARRAGRAVADRRDRAVATRLEERAARLPDGRLAPGVEAARSPAARARVVKLSQLAAPDSVAARARAAKVAARQADAPPVAPLRGRDAFQAVPDPTVDLPTRAPFSGRDYAGLSREQLEAGAVSEYKGSGFAVVNNSLRHQLDLDALDPISRKPIYGGVRETIDGLDSLLERSVLDRPVEVYRGLGRVDELLGDGPAVGRVITDDAFSSTSVDWSVAEKFAGRAGTEAAIMRIRVPAGARALRIGEDTWESEVVLARGARYRVVADRVEGDRRVLDVELEVDVPAPGPVQAPAGVVDDLARLDELGVDELDDLARRRPDIWADPQLSARFEAAMDAAEVREVDVAAAITKRAGERTRIEDRAVQAWYAEQRRLDQEAVAAARAERDLLPPRHRDDATARLREEYDLWQHNTVLQAEEATRGNLLSPAGRAAGIDPAALWSGSPATAVRYASDELLRWWQADSTRRITYTEWRGMVRPGLRGAAKKSREAFEKALGSADDLRSTRPRSEADRPRSQRRRSAPLSEGEKLARDQRRAARERRRAAESGQE